MNSSEASTRSRNVKQSAIVAPLLTGPMTAIVWVEKGARFGLAVLTGLVLSFILLSVLVLVIRQRNR